MIPKIDAATSGVRWLFKAAAVALVIVGALKVFSAFGEGEVLDRPDPILGIRLKQLIIVTGVAELFIGVIALCRAHTRMAIGLMAMLSTSLLIYRIGLLLIGFRGYCNCLGSVTDALHIQIGTADAIIKGVLTLLIIASYGKIVLRDFDLRP